MRDDSRLRHKISSLFICVHGMRIFFTTQFWAFTPVSHSTSLGSRRDFLTNLAPLVAGAAVTFVTPAQALDFDAFEKGEIASDTAKCDPKKDSKCIPKLSKDEALCQYGGGGQARGEACMRVKKAGGKLPEIKKEKSLGGAYAM